MSSLKPLLAVLALSIPGSIARAQPAEPKPQNACPDPPRLNPTGKVLMRIAECNAAAGRVATAWRQFRQASNAAGSDRRTAQKAQERADAMVKLLPRLTVTVPTDVPLAVTIDDTNLPPEQWGVALAIDPGTHVVQSTTEDGRTWQTSVQVAIRENKTVGVEPPPEGAAVPPKEPPKEPTEPPKEPPNNPNEPPKEPPKEPSKEPAKPGITIETLDPVAYDHTRAPRYKPVRAVHAPKIDGVLDDEVWKQAPKDSTFYLETSKPYGLPTDEPTSVQIAYDARHLYVAVTCSYATPHEPTDTAPLTETDLREFVSLYLDTRHDHSSEFAFGLTPDGHRSDWEVWNNGIDANFEWTGLWEGKAQKNAKGWTAEFDIPWGTVSLSPHAGPMDIGINFRRSIASVSVASWSLSPPGSPRPLPSFAGHLEAIQNTDLTQIIRLVPYFAAGWSELPSYRNAPPHSWLRDLNGKSAPFTTYAGLYGRLQAGHGIGADFMVNPDFSQVTPDAALANLDRFELFFPEVRDFFVNAASTYAFGTPRYQLFYSRRIGLRRRLSGFDEVPILYGVNAGLRRGGTTVSVLEVYNQELDGPKELGRDTKVDASHTIVARGIQVYGPSRFGVIALNQTSAFSPSAYRAYGADGVLAVYQNHLVLSGFLAHSDKQELVDLLAGPIVTGNEDYHRVSGLAWNAAATFKAQELQIDAAYTDVGNDFRADLGFFERRGVHRSDLAAYYRPQIHSDLIRSATIGLQLNRLVDQSRGESDAPIFSRFNMLVEARLLDAGSMSFMVSQNDDTVGETFYVANNRIGIKGGNYSGTVATAGFRSAPGQTYEIGATYVDGYYFGGTQRQITPSVTLRLAKFAGSLLYTHYRLNAGPQAIVGDARRVDGDRLSARLLYAYSPDIRILGAVEANTLDPVATTQLVGSWRIDRLSAFTLVANRAAPSVAAWIHQPTDQVLLKFSYGITAP